MPDGTNPYCRTGSWAAKAFEAKSYRHKQFFITLNFQKMKTKKMSLATIQGKLSRSEMKNIMAGSGGGGDGCQSGRLSCKTTSDCADVNAGLCCLQSDGNNCCWSVVKCA